MKDIEPNQNLNKVAAALIGVLASFFFYLAYNTHTTYVHTVVDSRDRAFHAGMLATLVAIGGILLLFALLLLRKPPINAARVRFRSGGFRLEIKRGFRGHKVSVLNWAEITTVTTRNGGLYSGGRSIHVAHGNAGEVAIFAQAWTDCSSVEIIKRLQASAKASGYTLEKEVVGWFAQSRERWTVIQKT